MESAAGSPSYLKNNPFTPVFGKVPAFMVGRRHIIETILTMFDQPLNSPDRCSLFVGARGTGKTALLTYLANEAAHRGWIAVNVTARPHMLEDIEQQVQRAAQHMIDEHARHHVTGLTVAGVGGITWERGSEQEPNWRSRMTDVLEQLGEQDTGLLITVDEVDPDLDDMAQLVTVYQHFVREDRRVALLMAGLPYRINRLLSGSSTSFLRRAARHDLGSIPRFEVEEGFRLTVEEGGRTIDQQALERAADAIGGFPYMFQLVGYRSWNAAGDVCNELTVQDVERGTALAQEELETQVFEATLAELSQGDIAFLRAMASEQEPVERAAIAQRLGRSSSYVSTYKKRLLEAGIIEEPQRGRFTFSLPGFGAWLRRTRG